MCLSFSNTFLSVCKQKVVNDAGRPKEPLCRMLPKHFLNTNKCKACPANTFGLITLKTFEALKTERERQGVSERDSKRSRETESTNLYKN